MLHLASVQKEPASLGKGSQRRRGHPANVAYAPVKRSIGTRYYPSVRVQNRGLLHHTRPDHAAIDSIYLCSSVLGCMATIVSDRIDVYHK